MLNLIDGNDLPFVTAFIRTLRQTFPYVYFVPTGGFWKDMTRNTFVLLASPKPIDMARLSGFEGGDGTHNVRDWLVSGVDFEAFINDGPKFLLTDDYVPTGQTCSRRCLKRRRSRGWGMGDGGWEGCE